MAAGLAVAVVDAVTRFGLVGYPPIVERVLEEPRMFEPALLFDLLIPVEGATLEDIAGLAASRAFFSSSSFSFLASAVAAVR